MTDVKPGSIPQHRHPDSVRWTSDTDLTAAVASGDLQAQRELTRRLLNRIRNLCAFLMGNPQDAEDVAQNVVMEILRCAGSFRGESSLQRWGDRIAVHLCRKSMEKGYRRRRLWERWLPSAAAEIRTPEEQVTDRHVKRRMAVLMTALPPDRRVAMILHHVQGYSISEVAQMTDTLPNTVRDRLRVARDELRVRMLADPLFREWHPQGKSNA